VVRDHLDDFLETVSLGDDGHGLPNFVRPPPPYEMTSCSMRTPSKGHQGITPGLS
jgi:hypothetical protein